MKQTEKIEIEREVILCDLGKLRRLQGVPGCKFLAVPDVVGNHRLTLESFWRWEPFLRGWPLAFVLQDGCRVVDVPWSQISLFCGEQFTTVDSRGQ